MLGKLLKYELRGTMRYYLPLFGASLIFSAMIRVFGSAIERGGNSLGWLTGLLIFAEVLLLVALGVMMMVVTIQRFYKNLLGSEGYLMFTLPVPTSTNIFAKLIAATLWNVACALVITLSIVIMIWEAGSLNYMLSQAWQGFSHMMATETGLNPVLMLCEWLIVIFISVSCNILFLYLAMSIGQLFNEHKFLASFGAYIVLAFGQGTLFTILGNILYYTMPRSWLYSLGMWAEGLTPATATQLITLAVALVALIGGAVYYFFTHWLLNKKLNLT